MNQKVVLLSRSRWTFPKFSRHALTLIPAIRRCGATGRARATALLSPRQLKPWRTLHHYQKNTRSLGSTSLSHYLQNGAIRVLESAEEVQVSSWSLPHMGEAMLMRAGWSSWASRVVCIGTGDEKVGWDTDSSSWQDVSHHSLHVRFVRQHLPSYNRHRLPLQGAPSPPSTTPP